MAKETKKIKRESFMYSIVLVMFSQVFIKLVGLIYKVYLTNKEGFGDAGNAIYGAGYQIYALLLLLSSIGIPSAIAKLVSEKVEVGDYKGAHKVFKTAFYLITFAGTIGSAILFFGANYIANVLIQLPEAEWSIRCLAPAVVFVAMSSVIRGYFNGRSVLKTTANAQTLEQILKTVITIAIVEVVALNFSNNVVLMAAGANLATSISVFLSFVYVFTFYMSRRKGLWAEINKSTVENYEGRKRIIKNILLIAVPIALTSIISSINKNIDSFTVIRGLKNFLTEEEATIQYGILSGKVDTLVGLPLSLNIAFATVLVPEIAAAKARKDEKTISNRISLSLLITMLIALPCTLGILTFAQPILDLVFPNANAGANILQAISPIIIFTVLAQTVNGALQGMGKHNTPAIALFFGALVKLIINVIAIPINWIGIYGATTSSIICHAISFIIGFMVLRKTVKFEFGIKKYIVKPLVASVIMSILSYVIYLGLINITGQNIATLIALGMAIIIYGLLIIYFRVFNKEEIQAIFKKDRADKIYNLLVKIKAYK